MNKNIKGVDSATMMVFILSFIIGVAIAVVMLLIFNVSKPKLEKENVIPSQAPIVTEEPVLRRGTAEPVPMEIRAEMTGVSYRENPHISFEDLSYLTVPYWNFDNQVQQGHMIISAELADEVLDIFAQLYDIKYPIERMELIDKYGADDFESIEYNNTSAFNYRMSTSSDKLSKHALGKAIDINPQINPYVRSDGTGAHENAREYWTRDVDKWNSEIAKNAYIGEETEIYRIFEKYGWEWGGSWPAYRDYQHFEKP